MINKKYVLCFVLFFSSPKFDRISESVGCGQNVVIGPWNHILCSKSMLFQDGTIGEKREKLDFLDAKMEPKIRRLMRLLTRGPHSIQTNFWRGPRMVG